MGRKWEDIWKLKFYEIGSKHLRLEEKWLQRYSHIEGMGRIVIQRGI
jgi:hypothetical protein